MSCGAEDSAQQVAMSLGDDRSAQPDGSLQTAGCDTRESRLGGLDVKLERLVDDQPPLARRCGRRGRCKSERPRSLVLRVRDIAAESLQIVARDKTRCVT